MSAPAPPRLRVALVGCGQFADTHLAETAYVPTVEMVAVCDRHIDLARQAAARFAVPAAYDDLAQMLSQVRPDVVHVTTPAITHAEVATQALEAGCHVYVEKPFTVDTAQAAAVIGTAEQADRLVCVGHDQLFDPTWLECRSRIADGQIGDVHHVETRLGYPFTGAFGARVSSDPDHPVRSLPGGLFHNTISHPLARILDLLHDPEPGVEARWYRDGYGFPTELWVQLRGARVTGTLTFTTRGYPERTTRVYGTRGMIEVDPDTRTVRHHQPARLPGALRALEAPWRHRRDDTRNLRRNLGRLARSEVQYFSGLRTLIGEFADAVAHGRAAPIAPGEILRVTRVMDEIFASCRDHEHPGTGTAR